LGNLTSLDTGFRRQGILFATAGQLIFDVPADERPAFHADLLNEVRTLPHVETAALTTHIPLIRSSWSFVVRVPNQKDEAAGDSRFTYISPGFFNTMDTPILRGRDFDSSDTRSSRKVVIVNEAFVRRYISVPNPIGVVVHTVAEPEFPAVTYEIVGVVKDTRYMTLRDDIPARAYVPYTQDPKPAGFTQMVVRFSEPRAQVIEEIKQRISELHPDMGVQFRVIDTLIRDGLTMERLMAWLAGSFGVLAALLAVIGLYGVISFMVERRKNEIGVRFALGATRGRVIAMIARETAALLLVGLTIGAVVSLLVTRALGALLFELSPTDARTLIMAAAALAVIALLASYIPAWRASRVDPMVALRQE
jgi:predicted permease